MTQHLEGDDLAPTSPSVCVNGERFDLSAEYVIEACARLRREVA
jgi:hypothetical protein